MFYYPDKIILLIESSDAAARFQGPSDACIKDANIPCSIDWKKSAAGDFSKRVRTDALVTVALNDSNMHAMKIGAEFVIQRFKGISFEIMDVDISEGVFGGVGMLTLRCIRKSGQWPVAGSGTVREALAKHKAKHNRPGGPVGPGVGPGQL